MTDNNNLIYRFNNLRSILEKAVEMGINVNDILKKIDNVIETISSGKINIALIGSFSDGKTSAIAGLLGEVLSNMKIAPDESSDEIIIYYYHAFGKDFRIVDTPGLFGTKEKEIEGEDVRFSDITVKYLSEAHVIIYVCDAVNPLKDSHVDTIKHIMCDLEKLESTIFVINKMDEAGYDLTDEYDFARGRDIKTNTLKNRLRESLNLSEHDVNNLNIVCIAADPKCKGVEKWFAKLQDYYLRSHIKDFKELLNRFVEKCDVKTLNINVEKSSIKEMIQNVDEKIADTTKPYSKTLLKLEEDTYDMNVDMDILRSELRNSQKDAITRLHELRKDLISKIEGSNHKTIGSILQNELGIQGDEVTMYILERNINEIFSDCSEQNNNALSIQRVKIEKIISEEESLIKGEVKKGARYLGKIKIDGKMVKNVRDIFAPNHKFAPWGAEKCGKNLTKNLGRAAIVITFLIEGWEWYSDFRDRKKFNELKEKLLESINDAFADADSVISSEKEFFKKFAPSYIDLITKLSEREQEVSNLKLKIKEYETLRDNLHSWSKDAEYIDFEEIKH